MYIPRPIFKIVDVVIFPDTFWGGLMFGWLLVSFLIWIYLVTYVLEYKNNGWITDHYRLFFICLLTPFVLPVLFLQDAAKANKRIRDLEAQLKKRKK